MSRDPYEDFLAREAELYEKEKRMTHCDECGEPVGDTYYDIDGAIYCERCMESHKRYTED